MKTDASIPDKKSGTSKIKGTLGTFAGVFTPGILAVPGVILFLRLGYVVGNLKVKGGEVAK